MMDVRIKVKLACEIAGMSITDVATKMGTSQSNLSKRLRRGKLSQEEMAEIAHIIGCEYHSVFVFPDGQKVE